jgi:hypothetical protein
MRFPRLFLLLAALALVSCAGRERAPRFLDGQGGAQKLRPAGEGRFLLKRPVPTGASAFYLRYRASSGAADAAVGPSEGPAVELRVLDPAGGVLARRPLVAAGPLVTGGLNPRAKEGDSVEPEVNLQVSLPSGSRVAGFALAGESGAVPGVLEAGLARPFAGFELAADRLRLGTGVRSLSYSPASLEVELVPEPFAGRSWRIELEYALAGPAEGEDQSPAEGGPQPGGRVRARLEADAAGGRRAAFEQDALPGAQRWFLYPGTVGFAPARLSLRALGDGRLSARRLEVVPPAARAGASGGSALDPLPADPSAVLLYDPRFWRQPDYELFAWERFPGILILDTADYAVQDRFFKRLAFFVEKEGYRGRLLTDSEMSGRHGYNAHDYRAEDLARFFAAADAQGFRLNREEQLLRSILTANGLLRGGGEQEEGEAASARETAAATESSPARVVAGRGAVLSISRESNEILRTLLLTHEAQHGLFFSLPRYREACQAAWRGLQEPERKFWRLFLDWGGYDFRDDYLAANEMQAYLFQQPRESLNFYFRWLTADRLERAFPAEAPWLRSYLKAGGGGFETAFDRLAPVLRSEADLEGGRLLEWRKVRN